MMKKTEKYSVGLWLLTLVLITTFSLQFAQRSDWGTDASVLATEGGDDRFVIGECPGGQSAFGWGNRAVGAGQLEEVGCFDKDGVKVEASDFFDCQTRACFK